MDPNPTPAERWQAARGDRPSEPVDLAPPAHPQGKQLAQEPKAKRRRAAKSTQSMAGLALDGPEMVLVLDVERAMKEITHVPAATIHRAAAFAWASRAIAGYRMCAGKAEIQEGLSYLYLGEHYREAALAHAAMGEAWQPLFSEIDTAMTEDRALAFASMRGRSPVATR